MFSSVDTNIKLNNEYWKYFEFQIKVHHCGQVSITFTFTGTLPQPSRTSLKSEVKTVSPPSRSIIIF